MLQRRRETDEKGAVIVELAMVVPILLTLVLGMYEIGMAWGASQTVVQASRGGARTVSQLGTYGAADQQAVLATLATFEGDVADVQRIVIFDASGGSDLPAGCDVTGVPTGDCNIYRAADFLQANDPSHFDANGDSAGCGSAGASRHWCPDGDRNDSQTNATEIGVFVEFEAERASGFFGSSPFTITRTTVMRVEPRES